MKLDILSVVTFALVAATGIYLATWNCTLCWLFFFPVNPVCTCPRPCVPFWGNESIERLFDSEYETLGNTTVNWSTLLECYFPLLERAMPEKVMCRQSLMCRLMSRE